MAGPSSTRELRIRVLDRLRHMFGKTDDHTLLEQDTFKRYFDKNVRVTKRLEEGDMVFLDRPKHEPKITKERAEQIAKSKLLPKSTGKLRVIRANHDFIVTDQAAAKLSVSVDRCSKALSDSTTPEDHNLESDMKNPDFPLPHSIVNEKSAFFSDGSAYHQYEIADTQSPLHIACKELDPKTTSDPQPIPVDKPTHSLPGVPQQAQLVTKTFFPIHLSPHPANLFESEFISDDAGLLKTAIGRPLHFTRLQYGADKVRMPADKRFPSFRKYRQPYISPPPCCLLAGRRNEISREPEMRRRGRPSI